MSVINITTLTFSAIRRNVLFKATIRYIATYQINAPSGPNLKKKKYPSPLHFAEPFEIMHLNYKKKNMTLTFSAIRRNILFKATIRYIATYQINAPSGHNLKKKNSPSPLHFAEPFEIMHLIYKKKNMMSSFTNLYMN